MRTRLIRDAEYCKEARAFTRLECALCLVGVLVLVSVAAASVGNTRGRSQRAMCVDNLRLIGQGMQLWGVDHADQMSWQVFVRDGGTRPNTGLKVGAAFYEFAWLSNQLVTPKILVCPSDTNRFRNAAETWGNSINGGYFNARYRDSATSYAINVHSFLGNPQSMVCFDRNMRMDTLYSGTCSLAINNVSVIFPSPLSNAAWTNAIHGLTGNILTAEGSVMEVPDSGLKPYLNSVMTDDNGSFHLLAP